MTTRKKTTDFSVPLGAQFAKLDGLGELLRRLDTAVEVGPQLLSVLPANVRARVQFVRIDGTTLKFAADSSAWAMKLRWLSTTVIAKAVELGHPDVLQMHVRVRRAGGFPT